MAAIVTGVATATGRVAPRRGRYTQFSRWRVRIATPAAAAAAGRASMPVPSSILHAARDLLADARGACGRCTLGLCGVAYRQAQSAFEF